MAGSVSVLLVRVLVDEMLGMTTPSTANTPAALLESVVSLAFPSSIEPTPSAVDVDAVRPLYGVAKNVAAPVPSPDTPVEIGSPVQLVKVPLAGVPSAGVVSIGDVSVLLVSV